MANLNQNWVLLIGRILFSLIFVYSGVGKIMGFVDTVAYVEGAGVGFFPEFLVLIAIIFELGGGLMVFLGLHTRIGAGLLFLFTLSTMFVIHHFWLYPTEMQQLQMIMFFKNLSILGGALYIFSVGAGAISLDGRMHK